MTTELRQTETGNEPRIREIREQEIRQIRITLGRRLAEEPDGGSLTSAWPSSISRPTAPSTCSKAACDVDKRIAQGENDASIDHSHSRLYLDAGAQGLAGASSTSAYPYAKLDQVYYFLGFNYGQLGDRKVEREVLREA